MACPAVEVTSGFDALLAGGVEVREHEEQSKEGVLVMLMKEGPKHGDVWPPLETRVFMMFCSSKRLVASCY